MNMDPATVATHADAIVPARRQLRLAHLIQAGRFQWSWSHISSILIGAAVAWKDGDFDPVLLLLTWAGSEAIHAGTCMSNDFWDYRSGADNVGHHTHFNAGSRVIQEGKVSPTIVLTLSFVWFAIGAGNGLYLTYLRGWPILALGLTGGALGFFYTTPPAKLSYRGLDQLAVALCYGPLTVWGSYYVQAQRFTPEAVLLGLVYGITASMILYVKGFHDTDVDRRARKESIIIKLGRDRAARLFKWFFWTVYALLACGVLFQVLPAWLVLGAGSLPWLKKTEAALRRHLATGNVESFFALLVGTTRVHLSLAFVFIVGYFVAGLVARLG
jgi:1,4-dihydroxy-2-naphthoate octaprenyltransferase